MRRDLGIDQLRGLLDEPLTAVFLTYRANGTALMSPVWHEWKDNGFSLITGKDNVKVHHIRRDPRAAMLVYGQLPPFCGVEASGRAESVDEGANETLERISIRYLGEKEGREFAASRHDGVTVVRLQPDRFRAWDFGDSFSP